MTKQYNFKIKTLIISSLNPKWQTKDICSFNKIIPIFVKRFFIKCISLNNN